MARQFDSGVMNYTIASADITIAFPENEVKCQWCKFCIHNEHLNRDRCFITEEEHLNRDRCFITEEILFSREIRGQRCPFSIINYVKSEDIEG